MSVTFNIARKHLLSKPKQTLVATLGVTFGIAMFILMISFMTGINKFMDDTLLSSTAHIHIYKDITAKSASITDELYKKKNHLNVVHHQKPKKENTNIRNGLNIVESIRRNPAVEGVSPQVSSRVFFNYGSVQINGNIIGVDIISENRLFQISEKMVAGKMESLLADNKGLLLGSGLAKKLDVTVGDRVTITTPDGVLMNMTVRGIFQLGMAALDDSKSYANLSLVQTILQKDKSYITDINIRLKDLDRAPEMSKIFAAMYGYKASDWKEENASILSTFIIRNVMTVVVVLTMLVVAGFGIYNIMSMTINDKMKDIAILKANGFSGSDIRSIFLTQAALIGTTGGISGLLFGFLLCFGISQLPFNGAGLLNVNHLPVNFNPQHYFFGILFGILTTLIAGYMPSRKASKVDPVAILRA